MHAIEIDMLMKLYEIFLEYIIDNGFRELKIVFHGGEPACDGGLLICEIVDRINSFSHDVKKKLIFAYTCHTSGMSKINIDAFSRRKIFLCINRQIPQNSHINEDIYQENVRKAFKDRILYKQIITVRRETLENAEACISALRDLYLPTKLIMEFPSYGSCADINSASLLRKEEFLDFYVALMQSASKNRVKLDNLEPINAYLAKDFSVLGCRFTDECPFSLGKIKSITINNDGILYPCNRFAGIQAMPILNVETIKEAAIPQIFDQLERYKKLHAFRTIGACHLCSAQSELCQGLGGCPFFAYIYRQKKDPLCQLDHYLAMALTNI